MGADSFNWGAGMHQIGNAAGFIKANMPLGQAGMLSDQEAWDVAYFMNAHERPQDPRYAESVAATRAKYHDSDDSLYGIEVNGHLLGSDSPRPAASCCRRPSPEPLKARRGSGFRPCRAARFVILAVSASHARHLFMHANSGNVFMVVAPSGAGKSSLVRALLQQDPSILLSVSCTTRAPRPGEEDGREYRFVAVDDFKRMRDDQALLEWAEVHGNFYGTPRDRIDAATREGRDVLLEIDWQGARQVKQRFPGAIGIFILPPSIEELEARLKARGQDEPQVIARRLMAAGGEIAHAPECEYVIINQEFSVALSELTQIVSAARLRFRLRPPATLRCSRSSASRRRTETQAFPPISISTRCPNGSHYRRRLSEPDPQPFQAHAGRDLPRPRAGAGPCPAPGQQRQAHGHCAARNRGRPHRRGNAPQSSDLILSGAARMAFPG